MLMSDAPSIALPEERPILPLRDSVLLPLSVVPIDVGRPRSVRLVEELAAQPHALVGVVAQRDSSIVEPTFEQLFSVGTLARVVKVMRLGQTKYSVVLNGLSRFRIRKGDRLEPFMRASIERLSEPKPPPGAASLIQQLRLRVRELLDLISEDGADKEALGIIENVTDPGPLADLVVANLADEHASFQECQRVLETVEVGARLKLVRQMVDKQLRIFQLKSEITNEVQEEMGRSQREYVLRQQLRSILEELGEGGEEDEADELQERLMRADMPKQANALARRQLSRLRSMQGQSAEYNVTRNHLEWLVDLPWARTTPDQLDVRRVRKFLDQDHFGLDDVKRRIVEYSAVRQLRADKRGPILLFVGPPGVGKTSLGRSIARAMGRKYERISLGGVRDEAELRGHRRTYVGALPGRIIQALKKSESKNPVLVLDEIEKMGADVRGDPTFALLEVLDPEQNNAFEDHYVGVPFDLSQVMFLATANSLGPIPPALMDRLEVIEVPGYTRPEKLKIAVSFLVPKQLREHGLDESQLRFPAEALEDIIEHYTREAGVRGLEREIAAVCRDTAVALAEGHSLAGSGIVSEERTRRVLGPERYRPELADRKPTAGVVPGLGSAGAGGHLLFVEASLMSGSGKIRMTGSLRAVMQESAATAVSYVRSRALRLGIDPEWTKKTDLHVHIAGARASRDAAGLGLPVLVAVASVLLQQAPEPLVAVVGEVTLRGMLLPISDLKAKLLAAQRAGIRAVVLPERNRNDLEEVPSSILDGLDLILARNVDEALARALDGRARAAQYPAPAAPELSA